jgi:hypothetical protein
MYMANILRMKNLFFSCSQMGSGQVKLGVKAID